MAEGQDQCQRNLDADRSIQERGISKPCANIRGRSGLKQFNSRPILFSLKQLNRVNLDLSE